MNEISAPSSQLLAASSSYVGLALTVAIIDFPGGMNHLDRAGSSISHSTADFDPLGNSSRCLRQIFEGF